MFMCALVREGARARACVAKFIGKTVKFCYGDVALGVESFDGTRRPTRMRTSTTTTTTTIVKSGGKLCSVRRCQGSMFIDALTNLRDLC